MHGGGFITGDPAEWEDLAPQATARGYALAAVEYRLFPDHPWPAAFHDAVTAVQEIACEATALGLNPDRIAVLGRSSGGFLALMLASQSDLPIRCVIAEAAPVSPSDPSLWSEHQWLAYLATYFADRSLSPDAVRQVGPGTAPCLLIHGERDELVPPRLANPFVTAMRTHERTAETMIVPRAGHGVLEFAPDSCWNAIDSWCRLHAGE